MVLVDSSIWIESSRKSGDLLCKVAVKALLEEFEAATCSPVLLEVLGGARPSDRSAMSEYFAIVPHIHVTRDDWDFCLKTSWKLRDKGHNLPWNDVLIATVALRRDIRVYAQDKHFETMKEVLGLSLYQPGYGGMYNAGVE